MTHHLILGRKIEKVESLKEAFWTGLVIKFALDDPSLTIIVQLSCYHSIFIVDMNYFNTFQIPPCILSERQSPSKRMDEGIIQVEARIPQGTSKPTGSVYLERSYVPVQ
jgi:hypothetical protein